MNHHFLPDGLPILRRGAAALVSAALVWGCCFPALAAGEDGLAASLSPAGEPPLTETAESEPPASEGAETGALEAAETAAAGAETGEPAETAEPPEQEPVQAGESEIAPPPVNGLPAHEDHVHGDNVQTLDLPPVDEADYVLTTGGGPVTWDFRLENLPLYTSDVLGSLSLSGGQVTPNGSAHGASVKHGAAFSLDVPAGETTITLTLCSYGSGAYTVSGGAMPDSFPANPGEGAAQTLTYRGEAATITLTAPLSQSYLHAITAETTALQARAEVSGTVTANDAPLAHSALVFTPADGGSAVQAVTGGDGGYAVSLPVGTVYTVSFAEAELYGVMTGGSLDLTAAADGELLSHAVTARRLWNSDHVFSFTLGGATFTAKPAAKPDLPFTVSAEGGNGWVEMSTKTEAIVWADLGGRGSGVLNAGLLSGLVGGETALSGNTLTFTNPEGGPSGYTFHIRDNSASGVPVANGRAIAYDFGNGKTVSTVYTTNLRLRNGSTHTADRLVTLTGGTGGIYYNDSAHGIALTGGSTVAIKVAGDATVALELCNYSSGTFTVTSSEESGTVSPDTFGAAAAGDGAVTTLTYTGPTATLTATYTGGTAYLHGLTVTNAPPETEVTDQAAMPTVQSGLGRPLSVEAAGQRLLLNESGGSVATDATSWKQQGLYSFPAVGKSAVLEADVVVTASGNTNANGVFLGVHDDKGSLAMVGLRKGTTLRVLHTKEDQSLSASNPGGGEIVVPMGQTVRLSIVRDGKTLTVTATPRGGKPYTAEINKNFAGGKAKSLHFGLVLAGASATVTNMVYTVDGKTLYAQNDCYSPIGEAPVIRRVSAETAATRDAVLVSWAADNEPWGDGAYRLESRRDGGDWTFAAVTQELSFLCPVDRSGVWQFRVRGQLGNTSTGEWVFSDELPVIRALDTPPLTVTVENGALRAAWTAVPEAVSYTLTRRTADETAGEIIYTGDGLAFTDAVAADLPCYYTVTAASADGNTSNPSTEVWAMVPGDHAGQYLDPDAAAVIALTGGVQEAVNTATITLAGTASRPGTLQFYLGETSLGTLTIGEDGAFAFPVTLQEGGNTLTLIHTDADGKLTRLVLSRTYLPQVDRLVDPSAGDAVSRSEQAIPVYTTVQAAVDAAQPGETIYITAGSYTERLVVATADLTLVGEGRDLVSIHCYPYDWAVANGLPDPSDYAAGGNMTRRCAVYITSAAANFRAENLTFANDYDYGSTNGNNGNQSADALRCDANGASFSNVRVSGFQDTLYLHEGMQTFTNCRIEGLVDFIYSGENAQVLFDHCDIVFRYDSTHADGGVVAAPRTAADSPRGLVFHRCAVTAEAGCDGDGFRLARPWGAHGAVAWINCYMDGVINAAQPYENMSGNSHQSARFYERGTWGPGFAVNDQRRQLSRAQASAILSGFPDGDAPAVPGASGSVPPVQDPNGPSGTPGITPDVPGGVPGTPAPAPEGPGTSTETPGGSGGSSHRPGSSGRPGTPDSTITDIPDEAPPLAGLPVWTNPFTDVPDGAWYLKELEYICANGLMSGASATTFNPGGAASRQQIWMILARLSGEKPASMAAARQWAMDNGLSDGSNPGGAVTRQQLAALLYRYAQYTGRDTGKRAALENYFDAGSLAAYSQTPMAWAVGCGIITGSASGTLNPTGTATRAQLAVILSRFHQMEE